MRNLKRALSLGLTAAMISGLMVMGSSAASYADVTSENNVEAIEVLEAVGIMIGDENGNFNPDQNVTRNEMAVVMANLMEYNVASYKNTSPFTDVPAWAEPYVAACYTNGITSGYSDTIYGGSDTVTTAQAALMLMKALGYFQYASDFGGDWQLATTRQGNAIDLFDGVDSGVTQAMTRNDVAQLVLNTLRAGTVTASTDGSWTIGNVTINNNVQYSYITSNQSYATAIDDVRSTSNTTDAGRSIVELGEQLYQGDLKLNDNTDDDFMRPSRTWSYDGKEIGTYAKRELQIATYTTGVTGREMYDLLSAATIRDNELLSYVDGIAGTIESEDLRRSNENDLDDTGNGVLTEVYLDNDRDEITIVSINTWLAQANANYSETSESLSLNVFENDANGVTKIVDAEEVPAVTDVVEDQFVLVNMSKKYDAQGEVVAIANPEILEDSTVTKFSQNNSVGGDKTRVEGFFSKLTVDGTEYEASYKANYDDEVLNLYDATLLTDMSYNVYLDQYGYAIGVDLYEGEMNYVFITGYDRGQSHISIKTADAAAIFTDGTMDTITVNVTNTNKNIDKLDGLDEDDRGNDTGDSKYYRAWNNDGEVALNRWYTYTVDGNDVYTLKPVEDRMVVTDYDFGGADPEEVTINCSNVRLNDKYGWNTRAYGNDDSVYITVEAGDVDMSFGDDSAIVEVNSLYTGVQDVDIELTAALQADVAEGSVFTLKDKDDYVIASIVLGDAQGSTANYAFILTDAKSEGIQDGEYQWEFDAVLNGVKQTLTARSKYPTTISDLDVGEVQELRFDGDYVVAVKDIDPAKYINNYSDNWDDDEVFDVIYNGETLELQGRTLQSSGANDEGWTISSTSMPTVLRHYVNDSLETINYSSMNEALAAAGDASTTLEGKQFDGRIVMVLNSQGVAEWAFIDSDTRVYTGGGGAVVTPGVTISSNWLNQISVNTTDRVLTDEEAVDEIVNWLTEQGLIVDRPVQTGTRTWSFRTYYDLGNGTRIPAETYTFNAGTNLNQDITYFVNGVEQTAVSYGTDIQTALAGKGTQVMINNELVNIAGNTTDIVSGRNYVVYSTVTNAAGETLPGVVGTKVVDTNANFLKGTILSNKTPVGDVTFGTTNKTVADNYYLVTKNSSSYAKQLGDSISFAGDYALINDVMTDVTTTPPTVSGDMVIVDGYYKLAATTNLTTLGTGATAVWSGESVVKDDDVYYAQSGKTVTLTITTGQFTVDTTNHVLTVGSAGAGTVTLKGVNFEKGTLNTDASADVSTGKITFGAGETYSSGTIAVEQTVSSTAADNGVTLTWGNS